MIQKPPILITGIPRSGTSAIAAMINLCGAFGGNMSKRGRFSNDTIQKIMVEPYLMRMGGDKKGQYPLPKIILPDITWRSAIDGIMINEGYKGGIWMYKDSRLGLMWPVWNDAYKNARWVIVRRRTGDILNSCIKTNYMSGFGVENQKAVGASDEREGWLWMIHQYELRFVEMIQKGLNCKVIWPERMKQGNFQQMYELCDWLNLPWKEEALCFIDPLLWGNKRKERKK